MSGTPKEFEAANIIGPALNVAAGGGFPAVRVQFAIDVTTASAANDLSVYLTKYKNGHMITVHADGGDIYYSFDVTTGSIDTTARGAGGVTVCQKIPSGQDRSWFIPPGSSTPTGNPYRYLILRTATGTAVARGYVSSLNSGETISNLGE
jgi:hypothetical protein